MSDDPREIAGVLEFLGETMSRWGAAFAQVEEQAWQSARRAEGAAALIGEGVAQMQAVTEEQRAVTVSRINATEQVRAEAARALAGAHNASRHARAIQSQARAAVAHWADALTHAGLRLESGQFELAQAEAALEAAKATLAVREAEQAAAKRVAERPADGRFRRRRGGAGEPEAAALRTAKLQRAVSACEHARLQVRFARLRTDAAQEEVGVGEALVDRCKQGVERAGELVKSALASLEHAAAALALAHESMSLADAAAAHAQRGQLCANQATLSTREAAYAAQALSTELSQALRGAQGVREGLTAHETLHGRGVVALARAHDDLLKNHPSVAGA